MATQQVVPKVYGRKFPQPWATLGFWHLGDGWCSEMTCTWPPTWITGKKTVEKKNPSLCIPENLVGESHHLEDMIICIAYQYSACFVIKCLDTNTKKSVLPLVPQRLVSWWAWWFGIPPKWIQWRIPRCSPYPQSMLFAHVSLSAILPYFTSWEWLVSFCSSLFYRCFILFFFGW